MPSPYSDYFFKKSLRDRGLNLKAEKKDPHSEKQSRQLIVSRATEMNTRSSTSACIYYGTMQNASDSSLPALPPSLPPPPFFTLLRYKKVINK